MNLMLPQLQAAADVIERMGQRENVQEVAYLTQPNEPFSLVLRIVYRKTGTAGAPISFTDFLSVSPRGVVQEVKDIYPVPALYGYLGTLIPFDLNGPDVKVI